MTSTRFVINAPPYTYCRALNRQKLDLLPDNWEAYRHAKGNKLTTEQQLQSIREDDRKSAPSVPLASRLVDPVLLDFNTWTVRT